MFGAYERVPFYGITVGLNNIKSAKKIVLAVKGDSKSGIVDKVVHGDVSEQIPATILRTHPNVMLLLDRAAASLL